MHHVTAEVDDTCPTRNGERRGILVWDRLVLGSDTDVVQVAVMHVCFYKQ